MKLHLRTLFKGLTMLGILFVASCVSVKIPTSENKKATGITHKDLKGSFQKFYPEHVDAAWKNQNNGNSISYYTECENDTEASFRNIQKGLIRSISSAKVERELNIRVAGETGLRSIVSGQVDGQVSLVDLIIFSKDKCIFILTYVGKKSSFLENQMDFESFYQSFEVKP